MIPKENLPSCTSRKRSGTDTVEAEFEITTPDFASIDRQPLAMNTRSSSRQCIADEHDRLQQLTLETTTDATNQLSIPFTMAEDALD
ncbi:hypothetical protein [Absidia glauca]|uniref:Uncharacterized protein n=1 Tax=Absidia glauca TaxID=4829 RepID=A0A163IQ45_ABSGL|nr:hypothetical protein [Absidia glauca]